MYRRDTANKRKQYKERKTHICLLKEILIIYLDSRPTTCTSVPQLARGLHRERKKGRHTWIYGDSQPDADAAIWPPYPYMSLRPPHRPPPRPLAPPCAHFQFHYIMPARPTHHPHKTHTPTVIDMVHTYTSYMYTSVYRYRSYLGASL
jgi:hypothetical protein